MATIRSFAREAARRIGIQTRAAERRSIDDKYLRRRHNTGSSREKGFWGRLYGQSSAGVYQFEQISICKATGQQIAVSNGRRGEARCVHGTAANIDVCDCNVYWMRLNVEDSTCPPATDQDPQYLFDSGIPVEDAALRETIP